MSGAVCSVCGAVLRDGVCPNGHPQRASRRGDTSRERRRRRRLGPFLVLLLILAGLAYGAFVWVPRNEAAQLMEPSSEEFADALEAYRGTIGAFPPAATDAQVLTDQAGGIVTSAGPTREELSAASAALQERKPVDLPIVSSRPPLDTAIQLRDRMTAFYTGALEAVTSLEGVASYLTQAGAVLAPIGTLQATVDEADPSTPAQAVASAIPVSDQLLADLQALAPPDELAGLHSSLVAIAETLRADLGEVQTTTGKNVEPVVRARLQGIRGEIASFRETLGTAPQLARRAGLGPLLQENEALAAEISEGLIDLRENEGLGGITLPGQS